MKKGFFTLTLAITMTFAWGAWSTAHAVEVDCTGKVDATEKQIGSTDTTDSNKTSEATVVENPTT